MVRNAFASLKLGTGDLDGAGKLLTFAADFIIGSEILEVGYVQRDRGGVAVSKSFPGQACCLFRPI